MIQYQDWNHDSNVQGYDVGASHIDVQFKSGSIYRYTSASVGAANLKLMIDYARAGDGLNSFINRIVRDRYSVRLK